VKIGLLLVVTFSLAIPAINNVPAQVEPRPISAVDADEPTAAELLNRSIAYHDPQGSWERGRFAITDVSTRPDGSDERRTVLRFDNARSQFARESHIDGHVVTVVMHNDAVKEARLDGRANFSGDEIKRYQLARPYLLMRRNFWLYLLGLPMKLRDPGTRLDPKVNATIFQGKAVYELRVTYEEGVGRDTWYFYLDRETCALVGHRFYHNESAGDGEFTVLSEEVSGQGLTLPRIRKWHHNKDAKWFITHTILSIEAH